MSHGLSSDLRQYGLRHPDFAALLSAAASEINAISKGGANEATISATFDTQLAVSLGEIGVNYRPSKEEGLSLGAQRLRGRIDSRVGDVIIEFKQSSTFRTDGQRVKATKQVATYAQSVSATEGRPVTAYVTDGMLVKRISVDDGSISTGAIRSLDGAFLLEYARAVVGSKLSALSGANLVKRFTGPNAPTKQLAAELFHALDAEIAVGRTQMLFKEWQLLFKLAHDDTSQQKAIEDRRIALEQAVGVNLDDSSFLPHYRALFALQTAYSIVLKSIGMGVLQGVTQFRPSSDLATLATADRRTTQRFMQSMEDGNEVRERGVENLLEGDFFSWYAQPDQYTDSIHRAVQPLLAEIVDFEAIPAFHGDAVAAHDLFKDFYMHMIPEKVRHSLGEYYTPSWLADDTINQAICALGPADRANWRFLDPTCGSGTFLTMAMEKVFSETQNESDKARLEAVLERVVGVDLNPLAVLTARMNYFINISPLLSDKPNFHIPVYLGDASVSPTSVSIDGVDCLQYEVKTLQNPLRVTMPRSALRDVQKFTLTMSNIEMLTKAMQSQHIHDALLELVAKEDQTASVSDELTSLATQLVELEQREWNGIWPRIIADFLTTAAIGRFHIVAGNPPWIDWKNLPANYRRSLVDLCVERDMFSGDGVTGGINLNVCALIALTSAENWLSDGGVLAMLMPDTLLVQQSYEGFRRLKTGPSGNHLYLTALTDWQKAGHPFKPVQQKFLTYVFTREKSCDWPGVPVRELHKERGHSLPDPTSSMQFDQLDPGLFRVDHGWAEAVHAGKTYFTRGGSAREVRVFANIAGLSPYNGREGIEFYPQELMLFEYVGPGSTPATGVFRNYQNPKSKHRVPAMTKELELDLMRPLIKGPMISQFHIDEPQYFVPFYYTPEYASGRSPLPLGRLLTTHPRVAGLLVQNRHIFEGQTQYNKRIIGKAHATEFYAIARVGAYSHAPHYVCFRDNTRWGASVVSAVETPWGEDRQPVFQNHAVTICEREDGSFISLEEAHFICAILNSTSVTNFVLRSSEQRSFKIRVPVRIPKFDASDPLHCALADASERAHSATEDARGQIQAEIDEFFEVLFAR